VAAIKTYVIFTLEQIRTTEKWHVKILKILFVQLSLKSSKVMLNNCSYQDVHIQNNCELANWEGGKIRVD
jgi:hypothetical protein